MTDREHAADREHVELSVVEVGVFLKEEDAIDGRARDPEGLVDRQHKEDVEQPQAIVEELELDEHAHLLQKRGDHNNNQRVSESFLCVCFCPEPVMAKNWVFIFW